jgi:hypothetical protein
LIGLVGVIAELHWADHQSQSDAGGMDTASLQALRIIWL